MDDAGDTRTVVLELDRLTKTVPVETSAKTLLVMTEAQKHRLLERTKVYTVNPDSDHKLVKVSAWTDSGGLGEGWIYVIFSFRDGGTLHGGISPDGDMHT